MVRGRPRPRRQPRLGRLGFPRRAQDTAARRAVGPAGLAGHRAGARRSPRRSSPATPLPGGARGAVGGRRRLRRADRLRRALQRARHRRDERRGPDLGDRRARAGRRRPRRRRGADRPAGARHGAGARRRRARVDRAGGATAARRPASAWPWSLRSGSALFFVGMDLAADDGALWAVAINRVAAVARARRRVALALRRAVPDRPRRARAARRGRRARHRRQRDVRDRAHGRDGRGRVGARLALPARDGRARPRGAARAASADRSAPASRRRSPGSGSSASRRLRTCSST